MVQKPKQSDAAIYESFHDVSAAFKIFKSTNSRCSLHFHRKLEMVYVESGAMVYTAGHKHFAAQADDILYAHHFVKHSYTPTPDYKKIVLLPPPELTNDFSLQLKTGSLPPVMQDRAFNRTLKPVFDALFDLAGNAHDLDTQSALVLKGYINVLFGSLFLHYPLTTPEGGSKKLITDVLEYIDRHYQKPLSLGSIANAFGYNRCYFSKLWSTHVGENLTVYIHRIRLQNLVQIAKHSPSLRITELAYTCGFDSLTTFYRSFQAQYGISPKVYFQSAE